nr:MAG TPA: hypothetical protein [Caudoviricetes sp.]
MWTYDDRELYSRCILAARIRSRSFNNHMGT